MEPIKNNNTLCHHCLSSDNNVTTFTISNKSESSMYYDVTLRIQLCDNCIRELGGLEYINCLINYESNEEELLMLIKSLPPQAKEIICNSTAEGNIFKIDPKDYIEIDTDTAEDSIYEKYHMINNRKVYRECSERNNYCEDWMCGECPNCIE